MSKIDLLFSDDMPNRNQNKLEKMNYSVSDYLGQNSSLYSKWVSEEAISDINAELPTLRRLSQNLNNSNPLIRSVIQNFTSLVVGKGLFATPTPRIKDRSKAKELSDKIKENWETWSDACHIDGQKDLSSVLRAIVSAIVRDGDILVYITYKGSELKVDLIASNRIQDPKGDSLKKVPKDRDIFSGVQTYRRFIEGYWVKNNTAGVDSYSFFPTFDEEGRIVSVLLQNPLHSDRLNGYRSLPITSPILRSADNLTKLLDSELQSNIMKSKQTAVYKTAKPDDGFSNMTIKKVNESSNIMVISTNEDFTTNKGSDISNPNLSQLVKTYYQSITSVFNVPYNVLLNIMEDSSYSSNSAQRQVAWESTEPWREYLIRNLLKPLFKLVLEKSVENEMIEGLDEYSGLVSGVEFAGRPNIPLKEKDVNIAQQLAIEIGQKSTIQVANEYGNNAFDVLDQELEYAAYKKRKMLELGLTEKDLITPSQPEQEIINPNETK